MNVLPIRLKMLRKQLKFTQEDVAKRASTTIANISGYESGNQTPSSPMLLRLSNALNCSVDYLFGRSDEPRYSPEQSHELENERPISVHELVERYTILMDDGDALTKEEVAEMLDYIQVRRKMKEKR
ncbi:helix-turn-helix domain-containing protein [Ammoniphilus oxalaticus]|nr:helix-turn-helix domain-containing protein [Ammoniphilus oxalaticus]